MPAQEITCSETSDQATSADVLSAWVRDAREHTIQLVRDLDDDQLIGPKLPIVNPLLWEIGHAAWFQEHWVLQRAAGQKPIQVDGEQLFDSISIDHDVRWDLPLPTREQTFRYIQQVRDAVLELVNRDQLTDELVYFIKLSVFHEDMHTEAYTYTRQTLAYPAPRFDGEATLSNLTNDIHDASGDIEFGGGTLPLGAARDASFVFDNEKWAHPVTVEPFAMARTAVDQSQFAEFVDDDGYRRVELWSDEGWQWRTDLDAQCPVYWRRDGNQWFRRHFNQWLPLEPRLPVIHVNWFEAEAYCRWANRRLPSEAEWEFAAAAGGKQPIDAKRIDAGQFEKRHYPWGDGPPTSEHANLNWQAMGPVATTAHAAGDSPHGCRQLIGNVWEWTSSIFRPFPEFVADPYKEYSQPCFGECKVLRGGCWTTRARLIRNTWRNFYRPDRRDVLAGFRTCALTS